MASPGREKVVRPKQPSACDTLVSEMLRALLLIAILAAPAASSAETVGFLNISENGQLGRDAIGTLRVSLQGIVGYDVAPANPSLEEPLPALSVSTAERLTEAREALSEFRYKDAGKSLAVARSELARAPSQDSFISQLVKIEMLMGQVALADGKTDLALEAFRRARRLDSKLTKLDGKRYSPPVRALFSKAAPDESKRISYRVESSPLGSEVWIDGIARGVTPLDVEVQPGAATIAVASPGYRAKLSTVNLSEAGVFKESLEPLESAEAARSIRMALSADPTRASTLIPRLLVEVEKVIVVREKDGIAEAADFDQASKSMGEWGPATPRGLFGEVQSADAQTRPDLVSLPPPKNEAPWYKKTWGKGLLFGGGATVAIVGGLLIYSATRPSTYEFGNLSFE